MTVRQLASVAASAWIVSCDEPSLRRMPECPPDCPPSRDERHIGRQPGENPIPGENTRPGDFDWRRGRSAAEGELDVYVTREVAQVGDAVGVRIRSSLAGPVSVDLFRIGHYQGAGARRVASIGSVAAGEQPECTLDPSVGLVECPWSDSGTFTVGADWVSGLYLVRVSRPDGVFRFAPFVVRDRRAAELYFVASLQTAQAYNRWGGVSLYGDSTGRVPRGRARVVAHDRPFREGDGAGQMLRWEAFRRLLRWLRQLFLQG